MALEEISEIVSANSKTKPTDPTYSYRNNEKGKIRYVTFYYSPNIFAAPEGVAELKVGDTVPFTENQQGALAQRAQLPLAVAVPITYGQKIEFSLWSDVDDPSQIGGSIFAQISDDQAPLPTPKNIDFDGLVRLAKQTEVFVHRQYKDETVTKLVNMQGHEKAILTLAPSKTFLEQLQAEITDLEISMSVNLYVAYNHVSLIGNNQISYASALFGTGESNRNNQTIAENLQSMELTLPVALKQEITFNLQTVSDKTLLLDGNLNNFNVFYRNKWSDIYHTLFQTRTYRRQHYTISLDFSMTEPSYKVLGTNDLAGAWTDFADFDELPKELVDFPYQYLKIETSGKLQLKLTINHGNAEAASNVNPQAPENTQELIEVTEQYDYQILDNAMLSIPSRVGASLQLSMEIKTASNQWIEYINAATIAALIADSNSGAVLSPDKLGGTILPSTSNNLRMKMIINGEVETGVSLLLS